MLLLACAAFGRSGASLPVKVGARCGNRLATKWTTLPTQAAPRHQQSCGRRLLRSSAEPGNRFQNASACLIQRRIQASGVWDMVFAWWPGIARVPRAAMVLACRGVALLI